MNLEKRRFYTDQVPIETILDTIQEQVKQSDKVWKIDLIPLSPQQQWEQQHQEAVNTSNNIFPQGCNSQIPPDQNNAYLTSTNFTGLQQKLDKSHENEERNELIINLLSTQINEMHLKQQNMESIYSFKLSEDILRHQNEIKVLEKGIKRLKRTIAKTEPIMREISEANISEDDLKKSKEDLIADKFNLIKKLKVAELKLQARDQELQALYERRYKSEITTCTAADKTIYRARDGLALARQQEKQRNKENTAQFPQQDKENNHLITEKKRRRAPGLESLSILADRLLNSTELTCSSSNISQLEPSNLVQTPTYYKNILPKPASIIATVNIAAAAPLSDQRSSNKINKEDYGCKSRNSKVELPLPPISSRRAQNEEHRPPNQNTQSTKQNQASTVSISSLLSNDNSSSKNKHCSLLLTGVKKQN